MYVEKGARKFGPGKFGTVNLFQENSVLDNF